MERGDSVVHDRRTSVITSPSNGRLPDLTAAVRTWMDSEEAAYLADVRGGRLPTNHYDQLDLGDRCLWYRGVPSFPTAYNNNYQIVQTPDWVAILQEHIHDVRFIPLDGRAHLPESIRQFAGDSRGRWEGDTLVVETTNFNQHASPVFLSKATSETKPRASFDEVVPAPTRLRRWATGVGEWSRLFSVRSHVSSDEPASANGLGVGNKRVVSNASMPF